MRKALAVLVAIALVVAATPLPVAAQQPQGQISGTAKHEAKKPYEEFQVRARIAGAAEIASTVPIDQNANFSLNRLAVGKYVVELFNVKENKVVCTEGPFQLTQSVLMKTDVDIDCGRVPLAWLLLAAAGAAGLVAGVAVGGTASPSK